jgi:two-component system, chemotaxis family, sensor kinase CheA
MSTSGPDRPFADGFMDDYFAEADEHMVAVRRSLLSLEGALGSTLPPAALEELFRSFHSLKGISAMVELREAELLAHHMESCLRAVRQGGLTLTTANFEVLVDGVRLLEHVIAARRTSASMPVIDAMVEKLESLGRTGHEGSRADAPAAPLAPGGTPASANGGLWRVTFVPSPRLVERGVKVDTVRARLMQIGEVRNVAPKVLSGGGISFEFDVQTSDDSQLAQWKDDGLTWAPLEAAAAVPRGAEEGDAAASQERPFTDLTLAGSSNVVRVDLARLDELMRLVGDMVVTRSRLEDTLRRVEAHVPFQEWRALQDHSARAPRPGVPRRGTGSLTRRSVGCSSLMRSFGWWCGTSGWRSTPGACQAM